MLLEKTDIWQVEGSTSKKSNQWKYNVSAWVMTNSFDDAVRLFKEHYSQHEELTICKCFKVRENQTDGHRKAMIIDTFSSVTLPERLTAIKDPNYLQGVIAGQQARVDGLKDTIKQLREKLLNAQAHIENLEYVLQKTVEEQGE